MSQLKVNTIRHTGASSDAIELNSDGTCTAKITNNLSNRNLVINGAMQVAQRGTSSTSTGVQTVDRFYTSATGLTLTTTQHDLTSSDTGPWEKGFKKSYHIQNTSVGSNNATDIAGIRYITEAQDIVNSGWLHTSTSSYITFSFWVKSSLAGTYYANVRSKDSTNKVYVFPFTVAADTWLKVEKSIPGASNIVINNDNGSGLDINIYTFRGTDGTDSGFTINSWASFNASSRTPDFAQNFNTTSNATFEITGVQLEVSDHATDFEFKSYNDELARCQRYYQRWAGDHAGNYGISAGYTYSNGVNTATGLNLSQPMRATPTAENMTDTSAYVHSQGTSAAVTSVAFTGYTLNSNWVALGLAHADLGSANYAATLTNASNKYIALTAEL